MSVSTVLTLYATVGNGEPVVIGFRRIANAESVNSELSAILREGADKLDAARSAEDAILRNYGEV